MSIKRPRLHSTITAGFCITCTHLFPPFELQDEIKDLERDLERLVSGVEQRSRGFCLSYAKGALSSKEQAIKTQEAALESQVSAVTEELDTVRRDAKVEWTGIKQLKKDVADADTALTSETPCLCSRAICMQSLHVTENFDSNRSNVPQFAL